MPNNPMDDFNPANFAQPLKRVVVKAGDRVELQHEDSKLFLSDFGQWYRVGGDFNRDMLPPKVATDPLPHILVPINQAEDTPLVSGAMVRIRTTRSMPPAPLTMIGVVPGQKWHLCKHWGDELVQFYFTADAHSEWQLHLAEGAGEIAYGDTVRFQKHSTVASESGWLEPKGDYAALAHTAAPPPTAANWVIYPAS